MGPVEVEKHTGISLSDSYSMMPASSVSALCFAHKDSQYFAVGQIAKDQVQDYAARKDKGYTTEVAERWLQPILGYDPLKAWATGPKCTYQHCISHEATGDASAQASGLLMTPAEASPVTI